eukprot:7274756-Prymnesium_polylepis.1
MSMLRLYPGAACPRDGDVLRAVRWLVLRAVRLLRRRRRRCTGHSRGRSVYVAVMPPAGSWSSRSRVDSAL